jgi:hypothetical protein
MCFFRGEFAMQEKGNAGVVQSSRFDNAGAPRYISSTRTGWIGVFWIYGLALPKINFRKISYILLAFMVLFV